MKYHNQVVDLSEQQAVDCAKLNGCDGAATSLFAYYATLNGITL